MKRTDQILASARKIARRFSVGQELRTYIVNEKAYYLNFTIEQDGMEITDWGFDHEVIPFPQTWTDLVNYKTKAELGWIAGQASAVAYRFYYEVMKDLQG